VCLSSINWPGLILPRHSPPIYEVKNKQHAINTRFSHKKNICCRFCHSQEVEVGIYITCGEEGHLPGGRLLGRWRNTVLVERRDISQEGDCWRWGYTVLVERMNISQEVDSKKTG
jgi:hypothetical protein